MRLDVSLPMTRPPVLGLPAGSGTGVSPADFAPSAAPDGYHWEYVTIDGVRITLDGEPVVALVGNA